MHLYDPDSTTKFREVSNDGIKVPSIRFREQCFIINPDDFHYVRALLCFIKKIVPVWPVAAFQITEILQIHTWLLWHTFRSLILHALSGRNLVNCPQPKHGPRTHNILYVVAGIYPAYYIVYTRIYNIILDHDQGSPITHLCIKKNNTRTHQRLTLTFDLYCMSCMIMAFQYWVHTLATIYIKHQI